MSRKDFFTCLGILCLFFIVAYWIQFRSPYIADPDSLYHIRHAWLLRTQGIFATAFPWPQFSVIRVYGADLWYGFHLVLIPFTYAQDLTLGIKWAGVFITFCMLVLLWRASKILAIPWPWVWPLMSVFATPDMLYRIAMVRPHPLSLGLAVLAFGLLLNNGSRVVLVILGFVSAWLHISTAWILLLITGVVWLVRKYYHQPVSWLTAKYLVAGLVLGVLARPHSLATLKLAWIQVVDVGLARFTGVPLQFGGELQALGWRIFSHQVLPLLLVAAVIGCIGWIRRPRIFQERYMIGLMSSFLLSVLFLILCFSTRRAGDFFVVFLIMGISFIAKILRQTCLSWKRILVGVGVAMIVIVGVSVKTSAQYWMRVPKETDFQEAAQWLETNTKPGEIVFHLYWQYFPELFFYNQHNYYINGMDPIFLYAYDPSLYWKVHYLAVHRTIDITCGHRQCTEDAIESTADVLRRDFHAAYILIQKRDSPAMKTYLEKNQTQFKKVFETNTSLIFQIRTH